MQDQKIRMNKKMFRIGELSKKLKVKKFVIRFWEKEFDLKSDRSQGGQRFYSVEDLKTFSIIKNLLYNQKFTIPGAKKQLPILLNKTTISDISYIEENKQKTISETISLQGAKIAEDFSDKENLVSPKELFENLHRFKQKLTRFKELLS